MKNVAYKVIGHYLICAYNEFPPTDEDAQVSLDVMRSLDPRKVKCLVFTKGGGPTAAQRKATNEVLGGRDFQTAVVSDSPFIRGVITAFGWFNNKIKAFSSTELEDAFRYLDIPPSRWEHFAEESARVQAELEKPRPPSRTLGGYKRA